LIVNIFFQSFSTSLSLVREIFSEFSHPLSVFVAIMPGYGATIHKYEDGYKYFVLEDDFGPHGKYLPQCIMDSDFDTFNFFTQKPELPYAIGSYLKANPHTPQPPDNDDNVTACEFDYANERLKHEIHTVDPLHRCLLYPPWPGKTEAGGVEFKIVDWVQAGDPNDSQVVAVRILNSTLDLPTDVDLLAKIYDPLYFNHLNYYTNIFQYIDLCYRRESAVYRHLTALQGNIIPKYVLWVIHYVSAWRWKNFPRRQDDSAGACTGAINE
jgi:hypothetical protein